MEEEMTFEEWTKDARNFAMVLREAERQGLLVSFIGEDGKTRWRRTDKQTLEPVTDLERLN
jgi:hypothetical protein